MLTLRWSQERGHARHGWLESYHTFSFADYYDPQHMGFRHLRVINEDRVQPDKGFAPHSHKDMEIVTYVLDGALEHKDSLGNGSVIRPGDVQRMTAGTGVTHSEYNPSQTDLVHFLQIWILPERNGLQPGYEQRTFSVPERQQRLRLVASPDGRDGSVTVHQDTHVFASLLASDAHVTCPLSAGRHAWVHVARGSVSLNGSALQTGDAAAISDEPTLEIHARANSELLLFDLA